MKGFFIFIILLIGVITGVSWYTKTYMPEQNRKKLNAAALKYYKKNGYLLDDYHEMMKKPYYMDSEIPLPPEGSTWKVDHDDRKNPIKIHFYKYFVCPNDSYAIQIKKDARDGINVTCPKCKKTYYVTESQLKSKDKVKDLLSNQ